MRLARSACGRHLRVPRLAEDVTPQHTTMAITDVFHRRYTKNLVRGRQVPQSYRDFFNQVAHLLLHDVQNRIQESEVLFQIVQKKLARELSIGLLANTASAFDACLSYLVQEHQPRQGQSADMFVKTRLSLIELTLAELELLLDRAEQPPVSADDEPGFSAMFASSASPFAFVWSDNASPLRAAIREVNERFQLHDLPYHYHHGVIQEASDDLSMATVQSPFWTITAHQRWASVDREMKEALDSRDQGKPNASFHALKALESALKILSDDLGLTQGGERGAANYIDNLGSKRGKQYIASWESEQLKLLFKEVRNPQGHGSGSAPPLALSSTQAEFIIESAMSWIKSLITRP